MPQDKNNNPQPVQPQKKGLSKSEIAKAALGQGAALADELTTEHNLKGGAKEADPLARPFTKLPEPAYLGSGAAMTAGLTAVAHKAAQSKHRLVRALGKVAQDVQIGVNAGNAVNNAAHEPPSRERTVIRPPKMHSGGKVPTDGVYELQKGETVSPAENRTPDNRPSTDLPECAPRETDHPFVPPSRKYRAPTDTEIARRQLSLDRDMAGRWAIKH